MNLREDFIKNTIQFEKHCQSWQVTLAASPESIRNCESYKNLVAMGKDILPYIQEVYQARGNEDSRLVLHGLVRLVGEIAGEEFKIPEHIKGDRVKIRNYTINWLDANS